MPFSHSAYDAVVQGIFQYVRPASMLDIGAGAGKYGALMRAAQDSSGFQCHKVAVEVDQSHVENFGLAQLYDEVWLRDAYELIGAGPNLRGDLAIMGDVLEHLPKSRGIDLLEFLLYRFRLCCVIFPVDLVQGAWQGHASESHVSLWYPEDFARYRGWSCRITTTEGWVMCLVLMNGVFVPDQQRLKLSATEAGVSIGPECDPGLASIP